MDTKSISFLLKSFRLDCQLTQGEVSKITGINTDSLRRIEKGEVIPRLGTLHLLSKAYKVDILGVISNNHTLDSIYTIYQQLDTLIFSRSTDKLFEMLEKLSSLKATSLDCLETIEVEQLSIIVASAIDNIDNPFSDENTHRHIKALQLSIPDFSLSKVGSYALNILETRLLLFYALGIINTDIHLSNDIMLKLLKDSEQCHTQCNELHLQIILLSNISANYHRLDCFEKSIAFAQRGLDLLAKEHSSFYRSYLLFRKGIGLHLLGMNPDCELKASIYHLLTSGHEGTAKEYLKVLRETYKIHYLEFERYNIDFSTI